MLLAENTTLWVASVRHIVTSNLPLLTAKRRTSILRQVTAKGRSRLVHRMSIVHRRPVQLLLLLPACLLGTLRGSR